MEQLDIRDRLADRRVRHHQMRAYDDAGIGHADGILVAGDTELQLQLPRRSAQIDAEQPGRDAPDEDDQADGAEQIGDRVGDRHMAVELRLGVGIQRKLADGAARGTHDGGVGQRSRAQARGEPGVEVVYGVHQQDGAQRRRAKHHGEQHQLEGAAVQAAEELRPTLETDGIDEQHEEHRFELVRHVEADLADDQPHQQRAGHRAQVKAAQVNPADQHAQGDGQENRNLGIRAQRAQHEVDHRSSSPRSGSRAGEVNQRSFGTHFSSSGSPR
ncbi:hypothetical protein D9M71_255120 [compost metagenome]